VETDSLDMVEQGMLAKAWTCILKLTCSHIDGHLKSSVPVYHNVNLGWLIAVGVVPDGTRALLWQLIVVLAVA